MGCSDRVAAGRSWLMKWGGAWNSELNMNVYLFVGCMLERREVLLLGSFL